MGKIDFESLYRSLKLDAVEGAPTDVTFVPMSSGDTVLSAPKADSPAPPSLSGTLPRLQLQMPDAARFGPDDAELLAVQVLGEGGMGRVLLARQSSLGREVAVKVLRGPTGSEAAAESLIIEARTTGSLEHPSVVPVYALARDGAGLPALVMKRVDGLSWRELLYAPNHPAWERLQAGRDRLAFHVEVLVQVCNAIAHAHQRGVLHRDVKPANVLVGDLGEVYLADWGVALKRSEAANLPIRLVGTPAYLAPEMVTGDARLMDERTDVYLLGATLHEVLNGAPPHVGTNLRDVMQHAWESPPPEFLPEAPALLVQVCRRAMAADPSARFASATALRDELKRYLAHRGSSELALAATERLAQLEAMTSLGDDAAEQRRWYTLVSECRFGFAQALKASPDHLEARDGLRRCLEVAARHELERGSSASARAYLSELEAPLKDLLEKVAQLEAKDAERAAAHAHLERMTHDVDIEVARRQRTRLLLALAAFIALITGIAAMTAQREVVERQYDTGLRMLPLTFTATVYVIAALVGRRSLFSTQINRQFMALVGVGVFGGLAHRAVSVVLGMTAQQALTQDAVMFSTMCVLGGFTLHRTLFAPAVCFGAGAALCVVWPARAITVFGLTAVIAIATAAVGLRRLSRAKKAQAAR